MEQFTFYEIYSDVICNTDDVNAGKLINRICAYEFENAEQSDDMDDKERFYWGNVSEILSEVKSWKAREKHRNDTIKYGILPFTGIIITPLSF